LPETRRRRHVVDPGDRGELFFEGRGHRRGHGRGARAWERGGDGDRRVVDVGEVAHRELAIGDAPEKENGHHNQGRHDGAFDEDAGEAHSSLPSHVWRSSRYVKNTSVTNRVTISVNESPHRTAAARGAPATPTPAMP